MSLLERIADTALDMMAARLQMPDPASFGDPLAQRIEWGPLKQGGSNFRTHQLEETSPGRLEVKRSLGYTAFGVGFIAVGLPVAIGLFPLGLLFGVPFVGVGVAVLWPRTKGFYGDAQQCRLGDRTIAFAEVHAVQVLEELVSGGDSADYSSYELNLVLRDGERVNVADHGDYNRVRNDAGTIATMMRCPLWDAVAAPKLPREKVRELLEQKARRPAG